MFSKLSSKQLYLVLSNLFKNSMARTLSRAMDSVVNRFNIFALRESKFGSIFLVSISMRSSSLHSVPP